jgi:hypothetical protein
MPETIGYTVDVPLPAVASNSYILIPHTVTDLDDFTENHSAYLVSVYDEPERAAAVWRERLKRNPYGDEGFVSLEHYGHDLISGEYWDQVGGIWANMIEVVEQFLDRGIGESTFPGQPAPIALRQLGNTVVLIVGTKTSVVDPQTFLAGVVDEAGRYSAWVAEHIGQSTAATAEDIARARVKLTRSSYGRR